MTINDDRGATLPRAHDIDSAYPLSTGQYPPQAASPGKLAEQTISDMLGWKWREGDTKGFVAALTGSFELSEVQGRTEAKWTPRGYAIQADLGAVTGGQASLAARARSATKDALELLTSLRPLRTDSDPENGESYRALVRHDLEQIRQELESPLIRVARVDQLFLLLLGNGGLPVGGGDRSQGHLGLLRDEFGLVSGKVNTIEEERIQTSFITLADWVVSLFRGWQDARDKIDPFSQPAGGEPFFGPAVVALSQLLSATAAQVDEVVAMLRSVFVQQEDLEVLRVPDPDGGTMSLGGLLRWVREFATFEGAKLIESAGKEGVGTSFIQVARRLQRIIANLPRQNGGGGNGDVPGNFRASLPPGFFSSRVQRAIDELDDHLQEVVRIAAPIGRGGYSPSSGPNPPAPPTPQLTQPPSPPPPPAPSSGRTPPVPSVAELREGNGVQEEEKPPEAEEPPKPRTTRKRTGQ